MKITAFLLFCCLVNIFAAPTYSQATKISLHLKDVTIEEVLNKIEDISEFYFLYNQKLVDVIRKVDVFADNRPIKDILDDMFNGNDVKYLVYDRQIILTKSTDAGLTAAQQQQVVTGKITDQTGTPLPGVSVVITGTSIGIISNAQGQYTIEGVKPENELSFSFIGYTTQKVIAGNQRVLDITLVQEFKELQEVVVIGYGTTTKKEVTGSVSQTLGTELKISPATNLSSSLEGHLVGVTITQRSGEAGRDDADILIRGISTMGANTPLIVIDGIADRDNISRLDPQDIESVTVLKDASAAIYGAKAAAGVILVTTKRGIEEKPIITYTFNEGFVQPTRLPQMADAATYAQAWREVQTYQGVAPQDLQYSEEDVKLFKDGTAPLTHPNTNWFKALFVPYALQSRHNISLRGGDKIIKYFVSFGTYDQGGLYHNNTTDAKQYNFRANIDANISNNLKVGFDVSGRKEINKWPGIVWEGWTGNDSQWYIFWLTMRNIPTQFARYPNGSLSEGLVALNPIALSDGEAGYEKLNRDVYNGTFSFTYKIPHVEGLSIEGFAAIDNTTVFDKQFVKPWNYSTFDPVTNTYKTFQTWIRTDISLGESDTTHTSVTLNARLNYKKEFGSHKLNVFVAYEQNKVNGNDFWATKYRFDSNAIDQLSAGSTDKQFQNNTGSGYEIARQNYFGRASYNYADKYMLNFTARFDGSMNFPPSKRFGFFPGISGAWRISEEPFFKNVNFFNELKLRASYGQLGNDRIGEFQYLQKYTYGNNYVLGGTNVTGITQVGTPILNVTWETTNVTNLGIDATFLKKKISISLDVFKNLTNDMLISRNLAIPDYTGFVPPPENAGKMQNQGIETLLSYTDEFGKFGFSASGNFAFSKNKVLYIDEVIDPKFPWLALTGHNLQRELVLDAIGIYRTQADLDKYPHMSGTGLGDLIYKDVNEDGEINSNDRIPVELNPTPEIIFGLNLNLTYRSFYLNIFLQGQARAKTAIAYRFDGTGNIPEDQLINRWSTDNPNGTYPRVGNANNYWVYYPSTFWLQDASYLRLKTLELGYNFPKSILSKIGFRELQIYISGFNIATLSKIKDQDPENLSHYFEGTAYPQTKVLSIGVRTSF